MTDQPLVIPAPPLVPLSNAVAALAATNPADLLMDYGYDIDPALEALIDAARSVIRAYDDQFHTVNGVEQHRTYR